MCTDPLRSTFAPNWLQGASSTYPRLSFWNVLDLLPVLPAERRTGSAARRFAVEIVTSPEAAGPFCTRNSIHYCILSYIHLRYRQVTVA